MEPAYQEILKANKDFLVQNLDFDAIKDRLVAESVLDDGDVQAVIEKKEQSEKVELLLARLATQGSKEFDAFYNVLSGSSEQKWIAEKLATSARVALSSGNEETDGPPSASPPVPLHYDKIDGCQVGDSYKMTSKHCRGKAVVIVNKEFGLTLRSRFGADMDLRMLQSLFKWLQFDVTTYENLREKDMRECIMKHAFDDYSSYDCLAVAVSSHGREEEIYSSDELLIPVRHFTSPFRHNTSLLGKPKLFFIQACRGDKQDRGIDVPDGQHDGSSICLPTDADFLLSYATTPGYASFRNSVHGSWFIQALDSVIRSHAHREHLLDLLTRVNQKIAVEFTSNPGDRKQMPAIVSMLTKKLYLFQPGK
eukprot:m.31082 g.31082  ORF g.31082 m.31082 type:complete len:365 (+) comp31435_c0_seq1:81-1175(+)